MFSLKVENKLQTWIFEFFKGATDLPKFTPKLQFVLLYPTNPCLNFWNFSGAGSEIVGGKTSWSCIF